MPSPALHLAIVSALVLFLELALIRWLPAHVMFLTFFTNSVLLASFVGMSIGCLTARRATNHISRTPMWLAVTVLAALLLQSFNSTLVQHLDVGRQDKAEVVFFGTEAAVNKEVSFLLPVEVFMAVFFVLAALCLIGPGQEMGRAFARVASRTAAYSANLLGSLAGIAAFAACAYLQWPPIIWFAIVAVGVLYLLKGRPGLALAAVYLAIMLLATLRTSGVVRFQSNDPETFWSPYYRIDFVSGEGRGHGGDVQTNQISHQIIESRDNLSVEPYAVPHLFRRDVKGTNGSQAWPPFRRVLIIGSGTGNDLSRACQWCPPDAKIDAVDIDPVIQELGRRHHPDKPYQDPRVTAHLNDGRNFLRRAPDAEYDLVIFALVDSLVLHSGYSNLRLESFLFTTDSFKDVRRVLKPTGVCSIYNFFRQGWIAVRLREQMKAAFGGDPVVFTDPPLDGLRYGDFLGGSLFTAFFAGGPEVVDPLRAAFAGSGNSYWIPRGEPINPATAARFQAEELDKDHWVRLRAAKVEDGPKHMKLASDDWPFLYSREPGIPGLTWRGVGLVLILSTILWFLFVGREPSPILDKEAGLMLRSFLLGAGFMLVETKAVVHMALLFGSTWMVNTFVFAAVLLMSLAGNLYAGWAKPKNLTPYYIGLVLALILNVVVPLDYFLGMPLVQQTVLSCVLAFLPVAFAGVIFATSFGQAKNPDRVFGANVAGALVGGLTENLSMLLGFRYLLLVAVGYYTLSGLCRVAQKQD